MTNGLYPIVLKALMEHIAEALTIILKMSGELAVVPERCRKNKEEGDLRKRNSVNLVSVQQGIHRLTNSIFVCT